MGGGGGIDEGIGHGESVARTQGGGEGGDFRGDRNYGVLVKEREKLVGGGLPRDAGGVSGDLVKGDGGNDDRCRG